MEAGDNFLGEVRALRSQGNSRDHQRQCGGTADGVRRPARPLAGGEVAASLSKEVFPWRTSGPSGALAAGWPCPSEQTGSPAPAAKILPCPTLEQKGLWSPTDTGSSPGSAISSAVQP